MAWAYYLCSCLPLSDVAGDEQQCTVKCMCHTIWQPNAMHSAQRQGTPTTYRPAETQMLVVSRMEVISWHATGANVPADATPAQPAAPRAHNQAAVIPGTGVTIVGETPGTVLMAFTVCDPQPHLCGPHHTSCQLSSTRRSLRRSLKAAVHTSSSASGSLLRKDDSQHQQSTDRTNDIST